MARFVKDMQYRSRGRDLERYAIANISEKLEVYVTKQEQPNDKHKDEKHFFNLFLSNISLNGETCEHEMRIALDIALENGKTFSAISRLVVDKEDKEELINRIKLELDMMAIQLIYEKNIYLNEYSKKIKFIISRSRENGLLFATRKKLKHYKIISNIDELNKYKDLIRRGNRIFARGQYIPLIKNEKVEEDYEKLCDECDKITGSTRKDITIRDKKPITFKYKSILKDESDIIVPTITFSHEYRSQREYGHIIPSYSTLLGSNLGL